MSKNPGLTFSAMSYVNKIMANADLFSKKNNNNNNKKAN